MSEFKCCYTTIKDIQNHPNPEVLRLSIATIFGFQIVIPKDRYKIGDVVLYIPIDAVFKDELLEQLILGPNPKITFHNHRVRQVRIQKFPSAGLIVSQETIEEYLKQKKIKSLKIEIDKDISSTINVEKYEPPVPQFQQVAGQKQRKKNCNNPLLHSYNGLDNLKWFPDRFQEGEEVVIQEKLHGTNARAGLLPTTKPKFKDLLLSIRHFDVSNIINTTKRLVLDILNMLPEYEFCYGSNNVELTNRTDFSSNYYGNDVYGWAFKKEDAEKKMKPMEVIYGEIIGAGIQKGYDYGHKDHDRRFVLFDVKIMNKDGSFKWLNPEEVEQYAKERGFLFVPVLYTGPFDKALAATLALGDSVYCTSQKVREGIVVKAKNYNDNSCSSQKRALKIINPVYLDDKNNSDFH